MKALAYKKIKNSGGVDMENGNVMVIGGGGREHSIVKAIKGSKRIENLYALPGNGGIASFAECVDIAATDIEGIVNFALEKDIEFVIVTPDDPLVLGAVDALNAAGVYCFGPSKAAAMLEGSKVFAKEFMKRHNIPTAAYEVFEDMDKALAYLDNAKIPTVIKADGLALGKGVTVAMTREEAKEAVKAAMGDKIFGASGAKIVIEEYLEGVEVSVLSMTDGNSVLPLLSCMDHKRAHDGDMGPNTGGMGIVAPNPYYTDEIAERCMEEIFLPTIRNMRLEGRTFRGCLYFGLILTADGPKVIEYNCRFGDPETQALIPLMKSDLYELIRATVRGDLTQFTPKFKDAHSCCVVIASKGYPTAYEKGYAIELPETGEGEEIYIAGAKLEGGKLVSSGGRVLGAVCVGETLKEAVDAAYKLAKSVKFENGYYRSDIGKSALEKIGE